MPTRSGRRRGPIGTILWAVLFALVITTVGVWRPIPSQAAVMSVDQDLDDPGSLRMDSPGSAVFRLEAMAPGDSFTNCVRVTYRGQLEPTTRVRIYATGFSGSSEFAGYLDLLIEAGAEGGHDDCERFQPERVIESTCDLAGFVTTHTEFSNGIGDWHPSSTVETRSYRVTVTLDESVPNDQQGAVIDDLVLTWEAREA